MKYEIIENLNGLIRICNDGMEGFRACAENAKIDSPKLKALLIERKQEYTRASEVLSAQVSALGGAPVTGTTASGALHRSWLNVKSVIAGKSDIAVLEECERGENAAELAYQKALTKYLPQPARMMVEQQFQDILKNHSLIKKLLDEKTAEHLH